MPARFVLVFALLARSAWAADPRLTFFAKQLNTASDPRARAQAALALGTFGSAEAVPPLCDGLDDREALVRTSAAKALEQIGDFGAIDCLRKHTGDSSSEAQNAVRRALASLEAAKSRPVTLYIYLSPVLDKMDRHDPSLVAFTEERLRAALQAFGAIIGGPGDSRSQAEAIIRSRHLKGFMINPELRSVPSGIQLKLLGLTYPRQSILGEAEVTAKGAGPQDLIRALAPAAVKEAADTFDWSR